MIRAGAHAGGRLPSSTLRGAKKSPARQPSGSRVATDDPTRIGILRDQREPKELSSDQIRRRRITPRTRAKKSLVATVANSRFHSSHSQQRTSHFSNRNKNNHPTRMVVLRDQREPKDLSSDPIREIAIQLPDSNRSYRRLEFNISPTKQRTEALSNRSKSADLARIGVLSDQRESKDLSSVIWRQFSLPAILSAVSSAEASAKAGWRDSRFLGSPGGLILRYTVSDLWRSLLIQRKPPTARSADNPIKPNESERPLVETRIYSSKMAGRWRVNIDQTRPCEMRDE